MLSHGRYAQMMQNTLDECDKKIKTGCCRRPKMMGPYSTARIVDVCFCACVRTCCVPTTQSRQTPVYGRCKYGSSSLYYGGIRPHQERQGVWQHGSLSLRPLLALGRCQRVKLHSRTKSRESTRKASCRLNTIPVKCPAKYAGKLTAQFKHIKFES